METEKEDERHLTGRKSIFGKDIGTLKLVKKDDDEDNDDYDENYH